MLCILLAACSDSLFDGDGGKLNGDGRIQLSGSIEQLALTCVCDNGFCDGDVMGVYVVDYNGGTPGTLKPRGNRCDNVRHTFDEANNQWKPAYDIYWKDKHTHIDVYGYYPFANPESIDDYQFEVQKDQSRASADGEMGGYEASDFLWGKVGDVAPTTSIIRLPLFHRMSNARVTLIQGSGFADGEWANTEKIVLAPNLVRKASIDLATGEVKPSGSVESTATMPSRVDDEWRTIVVPQTVETGTTLFSITIGGIPYKFVKNEALTYVSGKMMNFSIKVDKKAASGQYKLTLVSESIATPPRAKEVRLGIGERPRRYLTAAHARHKPVAVEAKLAALVVVQIPLIPRDVFLHTPLTERAVGIVAAATAHTHTCCRHHRQQQQHSKDFLHTLIFLYVSTFVGLYSSPCLMFYTPFFTFTHVVFNIWANRYRIEPL